MIGLAGAAACQRRVAPVVVADSASVAVDLPRGGHGWLSRFDVTSTGIDHIARAAPSGTSMVGEYYPASRSPAFTRLDNAAVLANYQSVHSDKALALINCSFFERYDPETELSFPIKAQGIIITGGSSPYGPCEYPADRRYEKVRLKALVWNDSSIKVTDYDHKTGEGLNDPAFPDGLVTYDYADHPANVLAGDPMDKYQLLGVAGISLLVLTIGKGRMVDGAALMKRNGVQGTILTVDGGPSTHLWTKASGAVLETVSKTLPHYLGFRRR